MANRDPFADWQALGQQYWQGLTELGQKFITPAAPPPSTPWAEGMEQWTRMFQGQPPSAQQTLFDQVLAQGKTYVSTLEELFKAGAGAGQQPFDLGALARSSLEQFRSSQPWLEGLGDYGKWFDPAALEKLVGNLGGDAKSWLGMPAFGFNRQQQERLQQLQSDLLDFQQQNQRYNALISKSMEGAIKRMESKLGELAEPGRQLKSLKSVYDLWIDALEESYAEIALSPEFREVYGDLVNAQMKLKRGIATQVERSTGELGMPTRTELDGVHRKLATVRGQLRALDVDAVDALRAEVADLRAQIAVLKAAKAPAAAAPAKSVAPLAKAAAAKTPVAKPPVKKPAAASKAAPAKKKAAPTARKSR